MALARVLIVTYRQARCCISYASFKDRCQELSIMIVGVPSKILGYDDGILSLVTLRKGTRWLASSHGNWRFDSVISEWICLQHVLIFWSSERGQTDRDTCNDR